MAATLTNLIDPPPRLTGNPQQDTVAIIQWLNAFYTKGVLSGALLQPQNLNPALISLGDQASAADTLPYFSAEDTFNLTDFTPFARTILDDADADEVRGTIGAGDVVGPNGATADHIAVFDGASGKLLKDTGVVISTDHNDLTGLQGGTTDEFYHLTAAEYANAHQTYTLGDTLYASAPAVLSKLAGNTTSVQKFLSQTGNGSTSDAPSWQVVPAAATLRYYGTNTASDVTTYLKQLAGPYTPKTTISTVVINGLTTLANFITDPGIPNITFIPAGEFEIHVHADKTAGGKVAFIYAEFWEASAAGADIALIGTTEPSINVVNGELEYSLIFATGNVYTFASAASRIVCRVIASAGAGGATSVRLYVGGTADSHIELPSSTVDATNFVPYAGATADLNLGTHNFLANTVKATAAAGFVSSDGSTGFTGTVTTASLVGKTITIKDGLVTGFS